MLRLQAWLRSGQSRLNDMIVGQLPKPILCQRILSFLAEYDIEVVVGAIYIVSEEARLNCIATHGFSKEMADAAQSFELREGLIGQAAADRKSRCFWTTRNTRLFQSEFWAGRKAKPAALAIVPIVIDNAVIAVLELGFFTADRRAR